MPRLLSWNAPVQMSRVTWLDGPAVISATGGSTVGGFHQVVTGVGDLVSFRLALGPKEGMLARRERGVLTALHNGANAARLTFHDGDGLSPKEAGIVGDFVGQPWSNGMPWSNGKLWRPGYPVVKLAADAQRDDSVVKISDSFWGHHLGMGDFLSFMPFYFGMHIVIQVIKPGQYRLWPRLRKAFTTADCATLSPVMAVRVRPGSVTLSRAANQTEGQSVDLIEVPDYDVRDYYLD